MIATEGSEGTEGATEKFFTTTARRARRRSGERRARCVVVVEEGAVEAQRSMHTASVSMAPKATKNEQRSTSNEERRYFTASMPLERHQRPAGRLVVDLDDIDGRAGGQVLQAPAQVGQVDAIHRGAHADDRREKVDLLLGMLVLQTVHQVQLRADGPLAAGRGSFHFADDLAGRADHVGPVDHFHGALGMDENLDARHLGAKLLDMARR